MPKLGVLIGALVTLASLYTATAKSAITALMLLIPAASRDMNGSS
jgi:hypothetical protein